MIDSSGIGFGGWCDYPWTAMTANYKVGLTWDANTVGGSPPPSPAYFKVRASADISGWGSPSPNLGASDGVGDPDEQSTIFGSGGWDTQNVSATAPYRLIQEQPDGETVTIADSMSVNNSSTPNYGAYDGGMSLQIWPDTRGISLYRPGAIGEWIDSLGTTHGDTTYSFHNYLYSTVSDPPIYEDNPIMNWQIVDSSLSGDWGVRSAWAWTPNESSDTAVTGDFEMPFSGLSYANGVLQGTRNGPLTYYIRYACTDSADGATGDANYVLTVHDIWENWRPDAANPPTHNTNIVQGPVGAIGPLASAAWSWSVVGTATLSAALTGNFTASDLASFGVTIGGSVSDTVGVSEGVTSEPIPAGEISYPYVEAFWDTDHYLVNNYAPAGLIGVTPQAVDNPSTLTWGVGWTTPAMPC